jgi:hypothetical protein
MLPAEDWVKLFFSCQVVYQKITTHYVLSRSCQEVASIIMTLPAEDWVKNILASFSPCFLVIKWLTKKITTHDA